MNAAFLVSASCRLICSAFSEIFHCLPKQRIKIENNFLVYDWRSRSFRSSNISFIIACIHTQKFRKMILVFFLFFSPTSSLIIYLCSNILCVLLFFFVFTLLLASSVSASLMHFYGCFQKSINVSTWTCWNRYGMQSHLCVAMHVHVCVCDVRASLFLML